MNPLKAPSSLLHGFGIPAPSSGINCSCSSPVIKSRTVSFGNEADPMMVHPKTPSPPAVAAPDAMEQEAALLLSVSSIAENEVKAMGKKPILWQEDEEEQEDQILQNFPKLPLFPASSSAITSTTAGLASTSKYGLWNYGVQRTQQQHQMSSTTDSDAHEDSEDEDEDSSDSSYTESYSFNKKRARAVSIDSPESPKRVMTATLSSRGNAARLVSPLSTPVLYKTTSNKISSNKACAAGNYSSGGSGRRRHRHRQAQQAKRERRLSAKAAAAAVTTKKLTSTSQQQQQQQDDSHSTTDTTKRSLKAVKVPKGKTSKTILRKKFSWKNYPAVR